MGESETNQGGKNEKSWGQDRSVEYFLIFNLQWIFNITFKCSVTFFLNVWSLFNVIVSRKFHKNIECLKLKLSSKEKKNSSFSWDFYSSLLFVLFRLSYIFFNSLSASSLFSVCWKKWNQIMKGTFGQENETYTKAMLRPLNPSCLLVWSHTTIVF